MAPQAAVAPAPSSSSNSQPPPRNLAYLLLDLHQSIKTPMSSIPNPPHQTLAPGTLAKSAPFCAAAAAASSPEPPLLAGVAAAESSSALPGADAVGGAGVSAWLRTTSSDRLAGGSNREAETWDSSIRWGGRCSHLGPLRGRHGPNSTKME
jgi:hypothetical protein